MLIVRNNQVEYLGGAFQVKAEFNDRGKLLYCRPMFLNTEKNDKVFYGRKRAYRAYEKYKRIYDSDEVGLTVEI